MRVPFTPETVGRAGAPVLSVLASTWRFDRRRPERYDAVRTLGRPLLILAWHETLLPLLFRHRHEGIAVVVSQARDGAYLARAAERLGYGVIHGSSSRGRLQAMRGMLEALGAGATVAVTPDGPRGPRRLLKLGALRAARETGAKVIIMSAAARPSWRLRSWDRFMVPAPFAVVRVAYGEPFEVGAGEQGLEAAGRLATQQLNTLEKEIAWSDAVARTA